MKAFLIGTSFALLLIGCRNTSGPPTRDQLDSIRRDSIDRAGDTIPSKQNMLSFALTDIIRVDLNGDGLVDEVSLDSAGSAHRTITIKMGGDTTRTITIETTDGEPVGNFDWADSWGLLRDKSTPVTYEVDGELRDSVFRLDHPAIVLWQDGGGSGFFTYKNGKFVWMTTGC